MRNYLIMIVAAMCLASGLSVTALADNTVDWRAQERQLKQAQKSERDGMKLKERQIRQSLKANPPPTSTRDTIIHKMQHDHRDMILKQKDAMQKLKDQEKAYREYQRANGG
jgi:hypothetical protein